MDIATIIGLISSLVTIEEAGRGWVSGIVFILQEETCQEKNSIC